MSVSKGHVHSDNEDPINFRQPRWQDRTLRRALLELPFGIYQANRYDTDDELVLHLWKDGESWDIRLKKSDYDG